jgi:hypothetical protein
MPTLIPQSLSYFFSSDVTNKAQNVSDDGSQFTVILDRPLSLPPNAVSATLSIIQASIWNTSPNISEQFNNNVFRFTSGGSTYNIIFPEGLYSLGGLNGFLSVQLTNLLLPSNLITISGDESTQRSIITFLFAGIQVDFTIPNSIREILGFDVRLITAPTALFNAYSDNTANFNRVNSYLIRSNIVSQGIPINSIGANVIAQVPIDSAPGSQINYQPQHPTPVDASELIGYSKNTFNFTLCDQLLRPTPTAGETWFFILVINYFIMV